MTLKNHLEYEVFDFSDIQPIIQEEIVELTEYNEFLLFVTAKTNDRLDEGIFAEVKGALKKKLDFIRELATRLKMKTSELIKLFKNKDIFTFFQRIGWSFKKLFKMVKKGFSLASLLADTISEYAAKTGIVKWTTAELKKLDDYLQKHPKTKRIVGVGVASVLIFIWLNMTFTGDASYDFDFSDVLSALAGEVTLSSVFGGKDGVKLLMLFTTGIVAGLSFPWPGHTSVQFVGGVVHSLANKHKIKMRGVQV